MNYNGTLQLLASKIAVKERQVDILIFNIRCYKFYAM